MRISQQKVTPFDPVLKAIEAGERKIKISGLCGSSQALLLSTIVNAGRSFCLIAPSYETAERLYQETRFFLKIDADQIATRPACLFFPPWDILPYEPSTPRPDWIAKRMNSLYHMATNESICIVTTIDAFLQRVVSKKFLIEHTETLQVGEAKSREDLVERLFQGGYEVTESVENTGEISMRGGIVDLFPPTSDRPIRIEFFGDEIESIRTFNLETQRSEKEIDSVKIILGRENIFDPNFYRVPLSDYLPNDALLITQEPDRLIQQGKRYLEEVKEASFFALRRNPKYPKADGLYLPLAHLRDSGEGRTTIDLETLFLQTEKGSIRISFDSRSPASLGFKRPGQTFSETSHVLEQLRQDKLVVLVVRNKNQLERFKHLLNDHEIPWAELDRIMAKTLVPPSPILLTVGHLSEGFYLSQSGIVFLTEEAILGGRKGSVYHRQQSRSKQSLTKDKQTGFLASFKDLKTSDYVIHVEHGVGRYLGLKRLRIREQERDVGYETDFMVLEFYGKDKVYVPLESFNLVQRYIGREGAALQLDRLGGKRWAKTKAKVRGEIKKMTQELLDLYAQREVLDGHSFEIETSDAEEFAAAFEYDETPDQLRTIREVTEDMKNPKPMDRLVCGDVGYGKTEVAMRAVFQAVMNNKQGAVIVPTTLLAQQHYQTFCERFAPFPVKVAVLSRFRSRAEQGKILSELKAGTIDILIGTHRLLQKDVVFRDLGLIVIDEEHRFGVRDKERLKQIRKEVDVLSLTATPIPRTLQMAFAQIRNLSIIETPPADRLAIRTIMAPFDPTIIREAVFRELVRGGQVFFLHNRVHNIEQMGTFLAELLPEAKIGIAHGQMRENALENVMLKFLKKEYNLLLTTTIIESGIDIPSANTMIINNAERFGLSELYQLRGRVGRSGEQAYAYLLVQEGRVLTKEARQRLEAIQEFTELGSGFRIAARDLEIRGAGNLLGREQSGQIAAIGFELYLEMINDMVKELKGAPVAKEIDPILHFRVSAFMPEDYIPDSYQRLTLYKRLSSCFELKEIEGIRNELEDRYGPIPEPVRNLLHIIQLKGLAKDIHVSKLEEKGNTVRISFDPSLPPSEESMRRLLNKFEEKVRFDSPFSFELDLRSTSWEDIYIETALCLKVMKEGAA
ncbi:transcription-repair coupling factor [Nitrospira defluvii]|nr:transcription-repair coupling factor [Nitrospira defluvii]